MKINISEEELRARLLKPLDDIRAMNNSLNESQTREIIQTDNDPSTIMKYITNPTGKGTAYVANRTAIKSGLNNTYIKLLREHRKAFYAIPYIYENGDLLFHVKVPSEFYKDNRISYDVLFLISYDKNRERKHRAIKLYSNSPSFIYTYCYVYYQHGLFLEKLSDRVPNECLTKAPEVRNPIGSFGYEKSTYIAARYLLDGGCLTDTYVNLYGKRISSKTESTVFSKVADPMLLLSIYQHAQYERRKTHKKELTANERLAKVREKRDYIISQKKIAPKKGLLLKKSPRAKISLRTLKKNLD